MKRFALGVVGCGLRAEGYLKEMGVGGPDAPVRLAALADPNRDAAALYAQRYSPAPGDVPVFDTGPQLLEALGDSLDAVIIASPNAYHRESLVPALELGLATLLEKPVATTPEDCAAMWSAHRRHPDVPLMVGFVLRFSPFYRRIKQLIDDGTAGQILAVTATEEMNASLSSVFMRDWRRDRSVAGPLMLEKCSHDMDLLGWLIGGTVSRLSSMARRTHLVPRPGAADRCGDCQFRETCRYSPQNLEPYVIDPEQLSFSRGDFGPSNDLCVYNVEKDLPDHQTVNLAYDHGVLANFAVVMDQPINTRTIKVLGTDAQILGDVRRNRLTVIRHAPTKHDEVQVQPLEVTHDGSGHDGADSGISRHFLDMIHGRAAGDWPTLRAGIEASLIALAAEDASRSGRTLDLGQTFAQVFDGEPVVAG
jgi:predicted dehydrogenase